LANGGKIFEGIVGKWGFWDLNPFFLGKNRLPFKKIGNRVSGG